MTTARSEPAQQAPPDTDSLRTRLPQARPAGRLFREHQHRKSADDGGCWWFSSSGEGRFDLEKPRGTCYLGETEGVAVRERCGRLMAMRLPISEDLYSDRVISEVAQPALGDMLADLTSPASLEAGVTAELATTSDYGLSQAWAAACDVAGFGGLTYSPRFTPSGRETVSAIFSAAGAQPGRGIVRSRSLLEVLTAMGYPTVRSDQLSVNSLVVRDEAGPD